MEKTIEKRAGCKLLALDLDGTSLGDDHRLSPDTVAVLEKVRESCVLCFVTGRRAVDMDILGEHRRLPHYCVLNSGGEIWDTRGGEPVLQRFLEPEAARRVIRHCLEEGLMLNICARDYWGVNQVTGQVRSHAERIRREPVLYRSPEETPLRRIEGFTASGDGERTVAFIRENNLDLVCIMSEPGCYDIIPGGVGKWPALRWLAERLGVPRGDVIAAGNYLNDVEMLREAGVGVAVRNALPEVKAAADYVTQNDNNHGAVVEIAEKFLGITL